MRHDYIFNFIVPVDASGVPGYAEEIAHPMAVADIFEQLVQCRETIARHGRAYCGAAAGTTAGGSRGAARAARAASAGGTDVVVVQHESAAEQAAWRQLSREEMRTLSGFSHGSNKKSTFARNVRYIWSNCKVCVALRLLVFCLLVLRACVCPRVCLSSHAYVRLRSKLFLRLVSPPRRPASTPQGRASRASPAT